MNQYVKFIVHDEARLAAVERVVSAFIQEARGASRRTDEEWKLLFDEQSLQYFWWPTLEERKEWAALWFGTHYTKRHLLPPTRWDFASFIDTVRTNEWDLAGVRSSDHSHAVIEFVSHAYPFGGTDCLVALAEAFGMQVIERDDGTGPAQYVRVAQYWKPRGEGPKS